MSLYHSPNTVTRGLVLYLDAANPRSYPGSGTMWSDLSEFSSNSTLANNPTFDTANKGSFSFDGINDYALISNNAMQYVTNNNIRTVSLWLKTSVSSEQIILSGIANIPGIGTFNGSFTVQDGLFTITYGQSSNSELVKTLDTISDNTWKNITVVDKNFSGTSADRFIIYINGTVVSYVSDTNLNRRVSDQIAIGRRFWTTIAPYFDGNISTVSLYNRRLTSAEISQNFNATRGRYGI